MGKTITRTLITQHYNSITYVCCCYASAFLLLFLFSACVRRDALDNPTCQRSNSWTSLYARSDVSIVRQSSIRCCNSTTHCSPDFLLYALFLRSNSPTNLSFCGYINGSFSKRCVYLKCFPDHFPSLFY